jgi:molecular chaperone GrpE
VHGTGAAVHRLAQEASHYLEGWKRARADYENLHRRSAEERRAARVEGTQQALLSLLHVIDHFDAAFAEVPADLSSHPWVDGVRHIHKAFSQALEAEGVQTIADVHVAFDPSRHEAVEEVASDAPAGTVTEVMTRGYVSGGTVLRPAKVKVSSGGSLDESLAPAAAAVARGNAAQPSTLKTHQERKEEVEKE